MNLSELEIEIHRLPLDVRMDFLTRALASTRLEMYGLDKQKWQESIAATSALRLEQRLASLDLPCWSAVNRGDVDLPPGVVKTKLLWEGIFIKVLVNEDRCMAIPLEGYEFAVCDSHDEILHDKDARVYLDHFILKACSNMYGNTAKVEGGEEDECDFSSYASTTCLGENLEDLEALCSELGVMSWVEASDELRVTYLRGDLHMIMYDYGA